MKRANYLLKLRLTHSFELQQFRLEPRTKKQNLWFWWNCPKLVYCLMHWIDGRNYARVAHFTFEHNTISWNLTILIEFCMAPWRWIMSILMFYFSLLTSLPTFASGNTVLAKPEFHFNSRKFSATVSNCTRYSGIKPRKRKKKKTHLTLARLNEGSFASCW